VGIKLTEQQKKYQNAFREFVNDEIIPNAYQYDNDERLPDELIVKLARQGYLGAILPEKYGGRAMDYITYGLLNEELGRGCASVRSFVMMQNMVSQTLHKWGNDEQKERWLAKIASGETIAAFALTEPETGSDAEHIVTSLTDADDSTFIVSGHKKWITLGQIADLFLVFGKKQGMLCAFLMEKDIPGLTHTPTVGMLGMRASMLAELHFDNCVIPQVNLVSKAGFGFVTVGITALNIGRYSIAWGCTGIGQACLEACINHTRTRKQFGDYLKNHQLIQKMIAEMTVNLKAARMLCFQAGQMQESGEQNAIMEIMIAKYFTSKMAFNIANDAVQIHGAIGCSSDSAVQRHLRDAKIMEIIEGTSQIHQIKIAEYAYREYAE
jgi:alkylation response protein AidB-like acyl-CoA dehydrogenase